MSARAAWRLETLGFARVLRYVAGKADWLAAGMARAGENASRPRVGDVARRDVPTCAPDDRLGDVRLRVRASGWNACVVTNEHGVVLGFVHERALRSDPSASAESVMDPGPSTIRPNTALDVMASYMREHRVERRLVTTSDGRLVGMLLRKDLEQRS
jgi:CBS domain-containing protein